MGTIDDNQDGTYVVRYTIPIAGTYEAAISLANNVTVHQPILACVAASSPFVFTRVYDGINAY